MGTVILAIVLLLATSSSTVSGDDKLHIFALPVGQGDATIIKCPDTKDGSTGNAVLGKLTVIDMGSSSCTVNGCMNTKKAISDFIGDHKVKYIFLTHPNKDHYNLITAIEKKLDVDTVMIYHSHDKRCYQYGKDTPLEKLLKYMNVEEKRSRGMTALKTK